MEKICEISDVPKGIMKGFTVKDKQILIANVDGNFYAMDAICSHMHGYLPSGTLERNIVICPVHRAQFDVTSGKVSKDVSVALRLILGGAKDLQTYKILMEENQIYVDL
jgi:nitrite reductase/ring-hydroxylating ferredoxin subunit